MSYISRRGRRPNEYASKSAHGHVIKDPSIQDFLKNCSLPKSAKEVILSPQQSISYASVTSNPINNIITVDGGYTEVAVRKEFPSATICFFQIGALIFSVEDLENVGDQPFIDPSDMAKLNQIQRLKFTLPIRNVIFKNASTLTLSVRGALYKFFIQEMEDTELMETLRWFIFEEYHTPKSPWVLASCPACGQTKVPLHQEKMSKFYTFICEYCGGEILLSDVFRLHEAIDDELGAGGILGYVITTVEQIVLVHLIRLILKTKPALLEQILFIHDGPLAYFGQTANMYKPMRTLVKFLFSHHNLYMAGLEKSGPFVEHADEIAEKLQPGTILLLNNDYIYKYILPGKADPANPYGRTTYYSNKMIFKSPDGHMFVVSLPTTDINPNPTEWDLRNLMPILTNIEKLKCDMYDNALIPVALANKLVSLANHPSARILQRFAITTINQS